MMDEEFELEIDWIPEDTGAPYEADDVLPEVPVLPTPRWSECRP